MKKLELAYEIIKESKKSRALYLESGRDYHKVAAHMYSIFECYAHGLIKWDTARTYWHSSILEYLNLYKDNNKLYVMESNRMLAEYEDTLKRFKPALDEYKKVSEAKMVSNIVVKKQISESVAKDHSNIYFNKRSLSESAIKDIAHTTDWKKVVESYTNLTSNDKDRLRMLTIFENDTFNVTGWSKLNEGPTLDTTQMITTVMSEAPTPRMNPADIESATRSSTSVMPNQRPAMAGSIAGGQIGRMAGRAIAGPIGGMVGKAIGSQIGSQIGTNIAMNRANAGNPSVAAPTLSTSGSTPSATAPTTSMRPKPRPMATEDAPKTSIRPVARPGRSLPGGGYQWPNGAVEPGAGATFMTDMPRPMPRPAGLGANSSPRVNMADIYPPRGDMEMDPSNMEPPSKLAPKTSVRPQRRPASNVGRSEMSPTPGVWDGSTRGFESVQQEGYKTIKSIDKERYDEIPGLEGPFMTLSGKVVYYDPKEGSYYDRDTDMYLSYEEFKELDNDYSGMKNTRDMKEAKAKPGHNARAMARAQDIIRKSIEQSQKNADKKDDKKEIEESSGRSVGSRSDEMNKASKKAKVDAEEKRKKLGPVTSDTLKDINDKLGNNKKKVAEATDWEVSYDHGPHQSNTVSVKAKSKEEALDKAKQVAKDVHKHNRITSISISPKKNESLDEAGSYRDRGAQNMMKASRKADKEADKVRAQRDKDEAQKKKEKVDEAVSFKLKVTNPATGNSETQEFNSETALKDYAARAKQRGLKVSRINPTNEEDSAKDLAIQAIQSKLKKSKVSYRDPNAKTAREEDRIAKMLAAKAKKKNESIDEVESADDNLKVWEVYILNNYYNGKYADYGARPYPVLAASAEEARQVVLDNADAILKDLLSKKLTNGKRVLPPGSAIAVSAKEIGRIEDGTVKGRRTTMGYNTYFSPQGPVTVKLQDGNVVEIKGQQTTEANTSYEKDMDHDKAVIISGVKGVKSTPFRKKFKNMAAFERWTDTEEADNYEVHDIMNESALTESDIINFSSFAGMYSDGAHAYFKGKDGKVHKVSATGDRPRKFYIDGQETPWDEVKRVVGNQHIQPQQGMMHESNVNEAVTLDYSRHVRSHGKKPRDPGYSALWMFTTREYDMPDDDEIFKFQGSFADAKKAAAKWAKSQGAYRVYVME